MIVEIPKFTNAKMEISKSNKLNPIMFDIKNNAVRNIKNLFPYHGYIWNYGALPQTWENPFHKNELTGVVGDNDPIDACEIGSRIIDSGSVIQIKIIGVLGMIDQGEMDWKLIVINTRDPLYDEINEIDDVKRTMPGLLEATKRWFQYYKVPEGKIETKFAFNGEYKDHNFALNVVKETHESWKSLIKGEIKTDIDCSNLTIAESPYKITFNESKQLINLEKSFEKSRTTGKDGKWYFIT